MRIDRRSLPIIHCLSSKQGWLWISGLLFKNYMNDSQTTVRLTDFLQTHLGYDIYIFGNYLIIRIKALQSDTQYFDLTNKIDCRNSLLFCYSYKRISIRIVGHTYSLLIFLSSSRGKFLPRKYYRRMAFNMCYRHVVDMLSYVRTLFLLLASVRTLSFLLAWCLCIPYMPWCFFFMSVFVCFFSISFVSKIVSEKVE